MVATRHLEKEPNGLYLLDQFPTPEMVGDFGSGIGRRRIYFPDSEYIGFDREEIMVDNAKKYFPDYDIRLADITQVDKQYPEMAAYFDLILTFAVVQYNNAEEQREIYKCIHRCLKPEGLYYWRENKNNANFADQVCPDLFKQVFHDGRDQRVYRKL
jgi:SAM-dependent methyltransferase